MHRKGKSEESEDQNDEGYLVKKNGCRRLLRNNAAGVANESMAKTESLMAL